MNYLYSFSVNSGVCEPIEFHFEGKPWRLWPMDHPALAAQLERWVARYVARNVELLRPADDDGDPLAWNIYAKRSDLCQKNLERGLYCFGMDGFNDVINRRGVPFAEMLYQCVRFRQKKDETEWTREHAARIVRNDQACDQIYDVWREFNYPKTPGPRQDHRPAESGPESSQSAGTENGSLQSSNLACSPAN